MRRPPGAVALLLALLALAADSTAGAARAASAEHGSHARLCRRGEEWCRNRCVPTSTYLHHREHCGRVSGGWVRGV